MPVLDRDRPQSGPAPQRPRSDITRVARARYERVDRLVINTLRRFSLPLLRISLGIVFVWFGALKILDVTPVADLVGSTVYWISASWLVPALGVAEVLVGVGLLLGRALRAVLLLFGLQMVGTFLVLLVLPEVAFQRGNPLLLTVEGEFVIKNLVLLSAGLVVGSSLRAATPSDD